MAYSEAFEEFLDRMIEDEEVCEFDPYEDDMGER